MQLNGLRLDGKFSDSAPFTWAYAKNILLSRGFDRIENEPGDTQITTFDGITLGRITVPDGFLVFTWYDSKGYIKFVDSSDTVTDLITDGSAYLDFDTSTTPYKFIEGVHCYNNEGDLIVAWTTGVGKPMIINVTKAIATPLVISSESDLKSLYLFPEFNHNNFSLTNTTTTTNSSIITGGRLPSAAYFISLAYEIDTDVLSNFGIISNPIFITENDSITAYKQFRGNSSLVMTNKALLVNVVDLDTSKKYFKIALIQKTTTSTICYITKRVKINSASAEVLIDDLDKLTLFDLEEVLISSPGYINVQTITNINKRLRLGNVSKQPKLSLSDVYDYILTPRSLSISAISRSGTTVSVVCSTAHSLTTNDIVHLDGWSVSAYNGYFEVTVDSTTEFHYTTATSGSDVDTPGVGKTAKVDRLIINWITEKQASLYNTKGSYKDSIFIFNNRGFRTDEVYSLYFGLHLKTGGFYGIYHIPGREAIGTEDNDTTVVDGDTIKNYKLGSTATKFAGQDYGKLGFWENENEVYPAEYGNIAGEKIRHHRFPSAGQLHGWNSGILHFTNKSHLVQTLTFDTYVATFDINYDFYTQFYFSNLFSLGTFVQSAGINTPARYTALYSQTFTIALDINVLVYDFFEEGVLMHGEATLKVIKYVNNGTSFVATNLINQTLNATTNGQTLHFTLASTDAYLKTDDYITIELTIRNSETMYPGVSNATSSSINIYEDSLVQDVLGLQVRLDSANIDSSILTSLQEIIDSFEILYAKRTLNNQLVLDQSIVVADGAGYRFYGFDSMANLLNIEPTHIKSELYLQSTDYNSGEFVNEVINYSLDTTRISKVSTIRYLPAYNTATVPSNDNKENCYYIEPTSGTFNLRLVNLLNVKDNLYLDFSNQELISTGVIKRLTDNTIFLVYGGDTYIGHNSVVTFISSLLRIWYFPVESILNTGMRYEGENTYEKFYPLTDITKFFTVGSTTEQSYIIAMKAAGIANYYFYNNDFHMLNNFRQDVIDSELTSLINKYPNRIHSSMPQLDQVSSIQWHKFRPLDYFDMVNHKGEIYKMLGNEYVVYIQTKFSIFRGIVVDQMQTENISVALKTTEMFDRPLQELLDADGTYIQPWNKEGTILTPYGLVVADLNKGSIYVISDKANEITKLGIEDWFRKTVITRFQSTTKEILGEGVSLGYDDLYKRLIVSLKKINPVDGLTLSFSFEKMYWICFHDYLGDKYIWNSNGLYMIDSSVLYKLLTGNKGYYMGVYCNSIIDFIFNNNRGKRFLLENVNWITNIDDNGINLWNETITQLFIYSKHFATLLTDIVKREYGYDAITHAMTEVGNTLYQDGRWIFNDIKDYLASLTSQILDDNFAIIDASFDPAKIDTDLSKFITEFVIVRMLYTNTNSNKSLSIDDVQIQIKNILR